MDVFLGNKPDGSASAVSWSRMSTQVSWERRGRAWTGMPYIGAVPSGSVVWVGIWERREHGDLGISLTPSRKEGSEIGVWFCGFFPPEVELDPI